MALKMRLARGGSKKRPHYSIVIAEHTSPRDGRFIEKIGTFNPLLPKDHEDRVKLVAERAQHWLSVGVQPTDRVLRFLDAAGLAKREARNNPEKAKPGKKRLEREAANAEAKKAAEEAAEAEKKAAEEAAAAEKQAAEEAAAAEAEAPAEEAPVEAEAPAEEAKAEEAPAEAEAPAEEDKAEEAKADEPPAETEAPAEEAKAEEAPAEKAKQ